MQNMERRFPRYDGNDACGYPSHLLPACQAIATPLHTGVLDPVERHRGQKASGIESPPNGFPRPPHHVRGSHRALLGSSGARNDTRGPCTSPIDLIAADDLSRPLGAGARGSTHERRPLAVLWAAQAVAWTAPRLSNTAIALVGVVKSFSIPKWH